MRNFNEQTMYDLRESKTINLDEAECLKAETTYKFIDKPTGKKLIAKFISNYDDAEDVYLISEFKKLARLSGEPEIATVYYIAIGKNSEFSKSCYIMDFIEGDSLQSFLDKREFLVYEVLFDLLIQLASGLEKAHSFEIFHNDLHNENIIINNAGYLKLIDFLWFDSKSVTKEKDIEDFKRIASEFFKKCKENNKNRFKYIDDYCQKVQTFKGLKKELEMLDEISFELSLLNQKSQRILSKLFDMIYDDTLNMAVIGNDQEIPEKYIPELNDVEKGYVESLKKGTSIKYLDTQPSRIEEKLDVLFSNCFFVLKQIGLIDWSMWVKNSTNNTFEGPYKFNFKIIFTSKFLKWKKANDLLQFLEKEDSEIEDIIMNENYA